MKKILILLAAVIAILAIAGQVPGAAAAPGGQPGKPTKSPKPTPTVTSVTPTPTPTPTQTGNVPPSNIAADCSVDVAAALKSWLNSVPNGSTVTFPAGACYRVEAVLEFTGRSLTLEGNGATFRSLNPPADQRPLWRWWDSTVTMRNLVLDGSYASGGTYSSAVEHAHAVDLRGTDATLANLTMTDLGGDCVYFGLGSDRSQGSVSDSSCARIGRNGVSVTAGDNITIQRSSFTNIGFIGVDVEPNVGAGWGSDNVLVSGNTFAGTHRLRVWTVIPNAPVSRQTFTGNTISTSTGDPELTVGNPRTGIRPQDVTITNNVSTVTQNPPAIDIYDTDGVTITGNNIPVTSGAVVRITNSTGVTTDS